MASVTIMASLTMASVTYGKYNLWQVLLMARVLCQVLWVMLIRALLPIRPTETSDLRQL